jgi:hypothetical protein
MHKISRTHCSLNKVLFAKSIVHLASRPYTGIAHSPLDNDKLPPLNKQPECKFVVSATSVLFHCLVLLIQ